MAEGKGPLWDQSKLFGWLNESPRRSLQTSFMFDMQKLVSRKKENSWRHNLMASLPDNTLSKERPLRVTHGAPRNDTAFKTWLSSMKAQDRLSLIALCIAKQSAWKKRCLA